MRSDRNQNTRNCGKTLSKSDSLLSLDLESKMMKTDSDGYNIMEKLKLYYYIVMIMLFKTTLIGKRFRGTDEVMKAQSKR